MSAHEPGSTDRPPPPAVLLADASRAAVRALNDEFRALGWEVWAAEDLLGATAIVAMVPLTLVVAELALPGGRGAELLRAVADAGSTAPVVIHASGGGPAQVWRALGAGARAVVAKPATAAQLVRAARLEEARALPSPSGGIELSLADATERYADWITAETATVTDAAKRLGLHLRSLQRQRVARRRRAA